MPSQWILDHPIALFLVSAVVLCLAGLAGAALRNRSAEVPPEEYFGTVLGATLTLLGLILGFSFSMATSRYDERKHLEEEEANAIGTEFVRAQVLPTLEAARVQSDLKAYLQARISFYTAPGESDVRSADLETARLQTKLWDEVAPIGAAKRTAVDALVLSGMNDVLNSQGYTQAAWWNRIPTAAWSLMAIIGAAASFLVGYGSARSKGRYYFLAIVPFLASIAAMLIADLDSPRGGLIRVTPQNLTSLSASLRTPD